MNEYICKHCGINAEQMHATLRSAGEKYQTALRCRDEEFSERCELTTRIDGVVKQMKAMLETPDWWFTEDVMQEWIGQLTGKDGKADDRRPN